MVRPKKPKIELPAHVHCVRSKGRDYYSFHPFRGTLRAGKRVKLPGAPTKSDGTPNNEFWAAYRTLMGEPAVTTKPGTFEALIEAYKASPEWGTLSSSTRSDWSRYLRRIVEIWGGLQVRGLESKHVLSLRDKYQDKPAAANNLLRCLSSMLGWSIPRGWRTDNPCLHVKKLKGGEGYAPWTWEQITYFRERAKPELWWAAALALYSGQRQGDCLSMTWGDIADGTIAVVQQKTGKKLRIAMHRDLKTVLQDVPKRSLTVLSNTRGHPWTGDGFKTSWGKELDGMEPLSGVVFHGLRKSAVVFLLEAGCTDAEVSAITGQSRQMVEHYGRKVSQEKLAAAAVLKWEAGTH
ncbi:MAG: tyrosine-type recombinase/integrase [Rhodomicrobium sp.]